MFLICGLVKVCRVLRARVGWATGHTVGLCRSLNLAPMVALQCEMIFSLVLFSSFFFSALTLFACIVSTRSAMAEDNVTVSNNFQPPISRHQFDALLASHRAFQEVAIKVTDILQDPSRSACYQSLSSKVEDNIDPNHADYGHSVSEDDSLVPRHQSGGIKDDSGRHSPHQQELKPASNEISPLVTLQIENARARRAYNHKRQRSIRLYARASGSLPDAEYDFQCMPTCSRCLPES